MNDGVYIDQNGSEVIVIKSIILDDTLTDGEVIDNINELLKPTRMY